MSAGAGLGYYLEPEIQRHADELARATERHTVRYLNLVTTTRERWLLLHVKPAPWWCPTRLWLWGAATFLVLEERPKP